MKPPKSIKESINKIRSKSQFISFELRIFFSEITDLQVKKK